MSGGTGGGPDICHVTVQPSGIVFRATPGQSVMEAAEAAGYFWPTTCHGRCECATCAGVVLSGAEHLSPMGRAERYEIGRQRGEAALATPLRLCCQARVYGDVEIRKPGVRPRD